jgi:osmoprotectant transport system permease protein
VGAHPEARHVILGYDTFSPGTFIDAFEFMAQNPGLMWEKTLEHLEISAKALAISMALGLPIGMWLGHFHRGSFLAVNGSNILRALPSLAVIAIGLGFFGVDQTNVIFALVVLGFPVILTNAYVAVDGVESEAVEAARGMGMKPWQILTKVEIPLALPLTFAGIRTAAVFIVATATLGGIVGGGGLGDIIVNQSTYLLRGVIAGAIAVTAVAFAADFALWLVQKAVTPKALRGRRVDDVELGQAVPIFEQ